MILGLGLGGLSIGCAKKARYDFPQSFNNNFKLEWITGKIIKPDANQLVEALSELLDNSTLCQEMGENGKKLVMKKYSWDKIAEQMIGLYKNVLRDKIIT